MADGTGYTSIVATGAKPRARKAGKARERTREDNARELAERSAWVLDHGGTYATSAYVGAGMPPKRRERVEHVAALLGDAALMVDLLDPNPIRCVVRLGTGRERDASAAERMRKIARTMIGRAEQLGLIHASPDAVADLERDLVNVPSLHRAEWLARHTLMACGIDSHTAGKYVDDAAEHEAKLKASKSP